MTRPGIDEIIVPTIEIKKGNVIFAIAEDLTHPSKLLLREMLNGKDVHTLEGIDAMEQKLAGKILHCERGFFVRMIRQTKKKNGNTVFRSKIEYPENIQEIRSGDTL